MLQQVGFQPSECEPRVHNVLNENDVATRHTRGVNVHLDVHLRNKDGALHGERHGMHCAAEPST